MTEPAITTLRQLWSALQNEFDTLDTVADVLATYETFLRLEKPKFVLYRHDDLMHCRTCKTSEIESRLDDDGFCATCADLAGERDAEDDDIRRLGRAGQL